MPYIYHQLRNTIPAVLNWADGAAAPPPVRQSLTFNGIDQFIRYTNAFAIAPPMAFGVWVRMNVVTGTQSLIGVYNGTATASMFIRMHVTAAGNPVFSSNDGVASGASSTGVVVANTWVWISGHTGSVSQRSAYKDGANKISDTGTRNVTGIDRFTLGRRDDVTPLHFANCLMAAPTVWPATLSDANHLTLAGGTHPKTIGTPVLCLEAYDGVITDLVSGRTVAAGTCGFSTELPPTLALPP